MFNNINLQQRLSYLVLFCCVLLLAANGLGLYTMNAAHDALRSSVEAQKTLLARQADATKIVSEAEHALSAAQAAHDRRFNVALGGMIFTLVAMGFVGYVTVRSVAGVADLIREALKKIAAGNFTVRIDYRGGLYKRIISDINTTVQMLQSVITEVSQASAQLTSSATVLSNVTDTTSQGIQKQQNETDQVVSAMQEMSSAAHLIAENAAQAATAANDADKQAGEGALIVTQAISMIQGMTGDMENSTAVIHKLQQESTNIGAVLLAIKEIADQTNLLALNAAIEAARAGEQGRGFAVVADEVRTLAGRTQQATVEIEGMIESLQVGTKEAVQTIARSSERVLAGVTQATHASKALDAITRVVSNITDMNTQIASAAEEQSAAVEEINSSIAAIGTISLKTADGAQHTALASNDLAALAAQLRTMLTQFKV